MVLLCPDIGKVSPGPLGLQPRVSLSRPRSQSPASAASPGLCWGGPATAALTLEIEKKSNHRGWDYDLWNSFLLIRSLGQLGHVNTFCDSKIKISFNALFLLVYITTNCSFNYSLIYTYYITHSPLTHPFVANKSVSTYYIYIYVM